MDINIWQQTIDSKYQIVKSELMRIRENPIYKNTQILINYLKDESKQQTVYELNEYLENEFNLSKYRMILQELYEERIRWLKAYTKSQNVVDNEYYRNMSYKAIHEGYAGRDLLQLVNDNYENNSFLTMF